jgi:CRP-like cAMP-binding protein
MLSTHPLLSKLDRAVTLTDSERRALSKVPIHLTTLKDDRDVARRGDRPSRCVLVIEGMLATSKVNAAGKRQIMAFHVPGDIPDLLSIHLEVLDSDIRTVSESKVAFIDHTPLRALCADHPRIAADLWRATLVDAAIFREWVVNVGQRPALNRLAHLFCEITVRMDEVGLAKNRSCSLPLTQTELGEATGLSPVHVNRSLQVLRARGLLSLERGELTIHDWRGLRDVAEFQFDYLHLPVEHVH